MYKRIWNFSFSYSEDFIKDVYKRQEDTTPGVIAGKAAGGYIIHVPDLVKVPEEVKEGISAELPDLGKVIGWIKCENQGKGQQ